MRGEPAAGLLNMYTFHLERAARRLQDQNAAGALVDLRAALQHLQASGGNRLEEQHIASIISVLERAQQIAP